MERIVSAAMLMDDNLIVSGVRHFSPDMRNVLFRIYGEGYHKRVVEQGFITNQGRFVGREEALKIAQEQKQVINRCGGDSIRLFSENLY